MTLEVDFALTLKHPVCLNTVIITYNQNIDFKMVFPLTSIDDNVSNALCLVPEYWHQIPAFLGDREKIFPTVFLYCNPFLYLKSL